MLFAVLVLSLTPHPTRLIAREVVFPVGSEQLRGHLAAPEGAGPFPAVIYLHGGRGPLIGGNPKATAEALAKSGFIGFSPLRGKNSSLVRNVQEVTAAINYVKNLDSVDQQHLAIVGFSRGGLLAFMASTRRRDLDAVVLMAPAHGRGTLHHFLSDVDSVTARTLILVAKNDTKQVDHVRISRQVGTALKNAGKDSRLLVYPSYGRDGHQLFFEVRRAYWKDIENFLRTALDAD
ncbi:MAG: dienelactone hydrolase family protein [Fuerstiella sp.]|nr:dienelactone hydrolase family protein [Fuerstiella sp.]